MLQYSSSPLEEVWCTSRVGGERKKFETSSWDLEAPRLLGYLRNTSSVFDKYICCLLVEMMESAGRRALWNADDERNGRWVFAYGEMFSEKTAKRIRTPLLWRIECVSNWWPAEKVSTVALRKWTYFCFVHRVHVGYGFRIALMEQEKSFLRTVLQARAGRSGGGVSSKVQTLVQEQGCHFWMEL